TEVYDYLRLLFSRIGKPYCYKCSRPITRQASQEIIEQVLSLPSGNRAYILSPVVRGKKGEYISLFSRLLKEGFSRVRVDGAIFELTEEIKLAKYKIHNIEIVVDRIQVSKANEKRIADSIETALKHSSGLVIVYDENQKKEFLYNTQLSCSHCGISLGELEPRMFSFNTPYGACPSCHGLGTRPEFDLDLIIPDKKLSLEDGAIEAWRRGTRGYVMFHKALLRELARELDLSMDVPFEKLPKETKKTILYGNEEVFVWGKPFEGVIGRLARMLSKTESEYLKEEIGKYMSKLPCLECEGARLRKESLAVRVNDKSIWDVIKMSIGECHEFFKDLKLTAYEEEIAHYITKEIKKRLKFCVDVGLDYLTLDRLSSTLSGGEAQRIRLATQVGSALSGVIYILDEPTIGLHPRDDKKLINTLQNLKVLGNTVIVVEHDEQMINESDWIIDLGPGAGVNGGRIVYEGPKKDLFSAATLTGKYLRGEEKVEIPLKTRDYKGKPCVIVKGAKEHNLKNIDVKIPLEVFVAVTGVSGSGKSTLVEDILYKALARKIYDSREKPGAHSEIEGIDNIDKVIIVDQSPIGRTPRSNPATYTGMFTYVRDLFSQLPEAKQRGYKPARFSFNVSGGRCEACQGDGTKKIEMHFLSDVYVPCEICAGKRFNKQTLEVTFKGKSIFDVLQMDVDKAYDLFENFPNIRNILKTLKDVGLGYIAVGQSATTLSGGEAQRIKLASQLRKKATGKTIYILDEPTTGLHFDDVKKLLSVLQKLVDKKNTVLVIEHNLDVIKCADYIIDLGPEGGENGGHLVACGEPDKIMKQTVSYTGMFLKNKFKK
ncbi:MAG: excinuclease ABC subunit UvrA, partial [Candidatus Omnitrophota bacterium]